MLARLALTLRLVAIVASLAACGPRPPAPTNFTLAQASSEKDDDTGSDADDRDKPDHENGDGSDTDDSYEARHCAADCTEDCSGHEAGYRWAEENGITDVDDCSGNSQSFNEGCKAYVEDNE